MDRPKEEAVIKQGQVKYKEGGLFDRWKPRTAVLKNLPTGRLQFVLLDNKGVEKYHVPIEEYSGIYVNPKPDGNEKYTFSLISDHTTDIFSFESEEVMMSWGDVIQEKFGRVLVINITIPHRQHQLKQGLALLIVRDNAITITTTDQPPKLQCSFLIRHIKKYGDFDNGFVFETGNKCPKGEKTFLIRCNNNKKLYSLLDGLAKRSITIHDVISRHKFEEIATPQGSIPRPTTSPSFNFSKLSSQQAQQHSGVARSKLRSTSDLGETKKPSNTRLLRKSMANVLKEPTLPYYNVESDGNSYSNLGPDGKSIVPEVEYEIIPDDDVFENKREIKRHQRGSIPAPAHNYRNIDASKAATMGSSRHRSDTADKEYMNLDVAPSTSKKDDEEYVMMKTGSVHEASDNYVNLDPTAQTVDKPAIPAKDGENSSDNYINLDPTSQTVKGRTHSSVNHKPALPNKDGKNSSDNYVNFDLVSQSEKKSESQAEKKSKSHVSDNYINFDPTTQDSSTQDQYATDTQYANVDYSNKTGVRRYHSSPVSRKGVPTTPSNGQLSYSHIVFHHFPSDESPNSKPAEETATSVSEPKNDDSTDYAAHPVSNSEKATTPQQQSDPSQTSEYENLTPLNQTPGTDPQESEYEQMTPIGQHAALDKPQESEYEQMTPIDQHTSQDIPQESEYEQMTPIGRRAAQDEQTVPKQVVQPQQSAAAGYEDFVPVKANGNTCSVQTNQDNCLNGTYSLLQFHTENSNPAKSIQDDSSPYSLLSHSPKVAGSPSSSSNYSRLELPGSPKTVSSVNQGKPPMFPPRSPEKPLVPPRELKKRMQHPEPSSLFSVYPELPPRNPSFQGVIHSPTQPPAPPAGPKPTLYPQSVINPPSPKQSSSSLNYCEVVVLPAEIGQPKFRPRSAAINQTMPAQKSTDNYAVIDAAASLGLQKALQQQEHDRLA